MEFESEEDPVGQQKEHSLFHIKLTKFPTAEDLKHPGYNPAHKLEDIAQPITGLLTNQRGQKRGENKDRE